MRRLCRNEPATTRKARFRSPTEPLPSHNGHATAVALAVHREGWASLMFHALRHLVLLAAATLAAVSVQACSLNPQPLPPGLQGSGTDGGADVAADASVGSDAGQFGGGADSGNGFADGTAPGIPGFDGGATGDGGSSDGATDAASDAPTDAATDAPSDGSPEE